MTPREGVVDVQRTGLPDVEVLLDDEATLGLNPDWYCNPPSEHDIRWEITVSSSGMYEVGPVVDYESAEFLRKGTLYRGPSEGHVRGPNYGYHGQWEPFYSGTSYTFIAHLAAGLDETPTSTWGSRSPAIESSSWGLSVIARSAVVARRAG